MFFRKTKNIELFFELNFANHIKPEKSVILGMSYADLSFYKKDKLIGSYLYPQDSDHFIIQYPEKWVLKFFIEKCSWKDIEDISYNFIAINEKNEVIMSQSGKVLDNV